MIGKIENQPLVHDVSAGLKGGHASKTGPFSALMAVVGGQQGGTHVKAGSSRTDQGTKRAALSSKVHDVRSGSTPIRGDKHDKLAGVEPKDGAKSLFGRWSGERESPSHRLSAQGRVRTRVVAASKKKRQDKGQHAQGALTAASMMPFIPQAPVAQTGAKHDVAKRVGASSASKLSSFAAITSKIVASGTQHSAITTPKAAIFNGQHSAVTTPKVATFKTQYSVVKMPKGTIFSTRHAAATVPKGTIFNAQHSAVKMPKATSARRSAAIKTGAESHAHQGMKQAIAASGTSGLAPVSVHEAGLLKGTKRQNTRLHIRPLQSRESQQTSGMHMANPIGGTAKHPGVSSPSLQFSPPAGASSDAGHKVQAMVQPSQPASAAPNPFLQKAKSSNTPQKLPGSISATRLGSSDMQPIRQRQGKKAGADYASVTPGSVTSGTQPATQVLAGAYPVHAVRVMPALEAIVRSAREGATRIDVQLEPAHLGKIHVVLHSNARQQIHIHIAVEQGASHQMIEQHLPVLRQMMAQQGLNPGNFSMDSQQHHGQGQHEQGGWGRQPSIDALAERRIFRPDAIADRRPITRIYGEGYLSIRI